MGTSLRTESSSICVGRQGRGSNLSFRAQGRRPCGHPRLYLGPRRVRRCEKLSSRSQPAALGRRNRTSRPGRQPATNRNNQSMTTKKRVLSGMRPTGRLHLGHYFGALSNWVKLQNEYDCFFFVADWHALTTHYEDTSSIAENTLQVVIDWLSVGLDPRKSTLFVQSSVLEHAELHVLLSMITPLSWLERVPTYKEQIENLKGRDLGTYGFLGYPLLQSADIVLYGETDQELLVPVGEDQAPHIELTREVVRRFNVHFGLYINPEIYDPRYKELFAGLYEELKLKEQPLIFSDEFRGVFEASLTKRIAEVGYENFIDRLYFGPTTRELIKTRAVLREPDYVATETPRLPGL